MISSTLPQTFISIHTPARGVTPTGIAPFINGTISIHTPARGVTHDENVHVPKG